MELKKILSDQFCQAAILALRDWATQFESENHVVYPLDKYPASERVDTYGFFMYSVHNEVKWHRIAAFISDLSALYIPFYAQTRSLDPEKLSNDDARRIFLYMLIVQLEEGCRVTSLENNYETGFAYEGVLYALYAMGEEYALQGLSKVNEEIKLWDCKFPEKENEPIDLANMLSLQKMNVTREDAATEIRAQMLMCLFGNLLRESFLTDQSSIAIDAFKIQWDEMLSYEVEEDLKLFVGTHPAEYQSPSSACEAFLAALRAPHKHHQTTELMQLIDKTDAHEVQSRILAMLPLYFKYFERQSSGYFNYLWHIQS